MWSLLAGRKGEGVKEVGGFVHKVDNKGIYQSYAQVVPAAYHIEMEAFFDTYIAKEASGPVQFSVL